MVKIPLIPPPSGDQVSMKRRALPSLRLAALASAAGAGVLLAASPALGITAPTATSAPTSPSNAASWTFNWNAVSPDTPGDTVSYEWVLVPNPTDTPASGTDTAGATSVVASPVEGTQYFRVRAVETGATPGAGDYSSPVTVLYDKTGPTASGVSLSGNVGKDNWYPAPLTVTPLGCSDAGVGGGCAAQTWTTQGDFHVIPTALTLTDSLGNVGSVGFGGAAQPFGYDNTPPVSGKGVPIAPGTLVASEPTFEWSAGQDALSGVDRYEVVFSTSDNFSDEYPGGGQVIVKRNDTGGVGNYTGARDDALRPAPLPQNTPMKWWVRTYDNAGKVRNSNAKDLTIDPTVPAAPTITGGPNAPTQDTSPTFTWTGDQTNFHWELFTVGGQNPLRQGGGDNVTQTTLASLPDGDYVLVVTQITPAGQSSAEASRTFKVDTTPPAAPGILTRPTFPAITDAATFTWTMEPGAYSRWTILDAAGNVVYGPIDSPVATAKLPALAEGPYTFQVLQIDAAGNASAATSEGFTVIAPLATPSQNTRTALLAALPKQNALRLTPKAGTILPTLRPLLRWRKGPRGTKLYNLQIFKVTQKRAGAKPKVTKVLSKFPRGLQFRPGRKNLQANTCYVWRVWPYTGTAFTSRPVGVSNFCVASRKVLRTKALKKSAKSKAAAR